MYLQFCAPAVIDKTITTLDGILLGISLDKMLSDAESNSLYNWCIDNAPLAKKKPYNELFETIFDAISDNILTLDEKDNILWLCQKLRSSGAYYDDVTPGLQTLHGILYGILADNIISKEELLALEDWMARNETLSSYYPFDEVGNNGNMCWAYSCYGRKVEKAIELRKKGDNIVIVNEVDFWDSF